MNMVMHKQAGLLEIQARANQTVQEVVVPSASLGIMSSLLTDHCTIPILVPQGNYNMRPPSHLLTATGFVTERAGSGAPRWCSAAHQPGVPVEHFVPPRNLLWP